MTGRHLPVVALVLNWNGESDSAACIDSLLAQRNVELDIVVIDNASEDGSGDRLHARYPELHYLQTGANLGYAGGNNVGIEWALARGAEWILVINNDTVADKQCVDRLLRILLDEPRIAAVAPLIVRYDAPERIWFGGGHFSHLRAAGTHEHEGRLVHEVVADTPAWTRCTFLTGCCLLLRASAIRQVGPFRADFFAYVEDLDLSVRLQNHGWILGLVPGARLAHKVPPRRAEPSAWQIRMRDRNRRRFVRAHYTLGWRWLFYVWFWTTRFVHFGRYALARDTDRLKGLVAGMTES